jgi:dihydrofolate synthase/folylpolyglutamate synthase
MTYEQALAFWYSRINYELVPAKASDLKLDRMKALLRSLGNPQEHLRIVHVAGSKGKGSTSAMLAAVLQGAGYRTGLFTSPHLCRVEERIQVDGESISSAELATLLAEIAEVTGAGTGRRRAALAPTFFEIATALGFLHFLRRRADVAVVEVGLGGRFDSTNVCRPLVAVITSISYDHTQVLGSRLASISMEKAGIIKPGCPAVSGARAPEARAVIERTCRQRGARLRQLDVDFHYRYEPGRVGTGEPGGPPDRKPRVQVTTDRHTWPVMELGLVGEHQAANAAVAVACVEHLRERGLRVDDAAVAAGLAGVRWPARLEVVGRRPLVVLDCAHNGASVEALVATLRESFPPTRRLLLFAGSGDKDLAAMLRTLAPHFAHAYLTRYTTNPRAVAPEALAALLGPAAGLPFTVCPDPVEALKAASASAGPDDLICVTGSVFLAGQLRPILLGGANGDALALGAASGPRDRAG